MSTLTLAALHCQDRQVHTSRLFGENGVSNQTNCAQMCAQTARCSFGGTMLSQPAKTRHFEYFLNHVVSTILPQQTQTRHFNQDVKPRGPYCSTTTYTDKTSGAPYLERRRRFSSAPCRPGRRFPSSCSRGARSPEARGRTPEFYNDYSL